MSRAPRTDVGWGEEDRRQALLLMLNSHYACQSYAAAFTASGGTDLLAWRIATSSLPNAIWKGQRA